MFNLDFELEGQKLISRNFLILADDITSMRPEFTQVGKRIIEGVNTNFKTEGTEVNKWTKLSPSTQKARQKKRGYYKRASSNPGILRWTGRLQKGFYQNTGDLEVVVSNKVPYFKYHQTRFRTNSKLPRRIMLDISTKTRLDVTNIIAKGLNKRVWNFGRQY